MTTPREISFVVSEKYLILPIQNKADHGGLTLSVDGEIVFDCDVALAADPEQADWHAFFSLERFAGQRATVQTAAASESALAGVVQSGTVPGEADLYHEVHRPQFHFTSKTGWINDPNGLIYTNGVYHMFYQHNPVGLPWGLMFWGHAVSTDLIHWEERPKALFNKSKEGPCFSGAAFIDEKDQLGRKTGDDDVIVLFYFRYRSYMGLSYAYSADGGDTFTDYEENPILNKRPHRIDTPRPFWHEPTQRWVSPTYDYYKNNAYDPDRPDDDGNDEYHRCVGFYSSADLIKWRPESQVRQDAWGDELCGCVDFFQLAIDGDASNKKWVMVLIDGSYIVGEFDGRQFTTLTGKAAHTDDRERSLVVAGNFYATMTWHGLPNDRRVQITWMGTFSDSDQVYPIDGMPFSQQYTVPSELSLCSTDQGPQLRMNPIAELESLRTQTHEWSGLTLTGDANPLDEMAGDAFDVEVTFAPGPGSRTRFELRGTVVEYDAGRQTISCDDLESPLTPVDGLVQLRILLDRTSIEVFANKGCLYMPRLILPADEDRSLSVTCPQGESHVHHLHVHELESIWR